MPTKKKGKKPRITQLNMGDTVKLSKGRIGLIRYMGKTQFGLGEWIGIELYNTLIRTRHNGAVLGKRYFRCPPNRGVFVRRTLIKEIVPFLKIQSSINKLREKEAALKKERKQKSNNKKAAKRAKKSSTDSESKSPLSVSSNIPKIQTKNVELLPKKTRGNKTPSSMRSRSANTPNSKTKSKGNGSKTPTPSSSKKKHSKRTKTPTPTNKVPKIKETKSSKVERPKLQKTQSFKDKQIKNGAPKMMKLKKTISTPGPKENDLIAKATEPETPITPLTPLTPYTPVRSRGTTATPITNDQTHNDDDIEEENDESSSNDEAPEPTPNSEIIEPEPFKQFDTKSGFMERYKQDLQVRNSKNSLQLIVKKQKEDQNEDDDAKSDGVGQQNVSATKPLTINKSANALGSKRTPTATPKDGDIDTDDEEDEDDDDETEDEEFKKEMEKEFEQNYETFHNVVEEYTHTIDDIETGRKKLANKLVQRRQSQQKSRKKEKSHTLKVMDDTDDDDGDDEDIDSAPKIEKKENVTTESDHKSVGGLTSQQILAMRPRSRASATQKSNDLIPHRNQRLNPNLMFAQKKAFLRKRRKSQFDSARSRRGSSFVDDYNVVDTLFFDGDEESTMINDDPDQFFVDSMGSDDEGDDNENDGNKGDDNTMTVVNEEEEESEQKLVRKDIDAQKQNEIGDAFNSLLSANPNGRVRHNTPINPNAHSKDGNAKEVIETVMELTETEEDDDDDEDEKEEDPLLGTIDEMESNDSGSGSEEEQIKIFDIKKDKTNEKVMIFYVELDEFLRWKMNESGNGIFVYKIKKNEYGNALNIETGIKNGWHITMINDRDMRQESDKKKVDKIFEELDIEKGYKVKFQML